MTSIGSRWTSYARFVAFARLACFILLATPYPYLAADDFPPLRNTEADVNAEPMRAGEAAESMKLPAGFKATVFAAEPDVQNPIAMTWDTAGRLWVAENFTYAERTQRFDLSFRDRVLVFADNDGDGIADSRTVFTDQVQMLTSVEVGHGGVWPMCPPQVLFIPDADRNLVPDGPAEVILDGFTVAQANYHNYANGLRFGPDGWLYGRCGGSCPGRIGAPGTPPEQRFALEGGMWRYHPTRKTVEVINAGTTNPWGHDWNERGELFFINTVNGHFWHGIAGAHFHRPFNLDPNPRTYETIDTHADHYHFDTGKSWTESRDGTANSYGGGHAHCGAMFYLGSGWPELYRGKFFTSNLHGRRLNQETVTRSGSGYVASHDDDFCLVSDPFFRGMDLSVAPDGGVMLIDWSDTGECHEANGVHRTSGRIYKITHVAAPQDASISDISKQPTSELIDWHRSENEWAIRKARLVLQERAASQSGLADAVKALRAMTADDNELVAVRAAMTLVACQQATPEICMGWLETENESLRAWAIRALFDAMPIDDVYGPRKVATSVDPAVLKRCISLAQTDPSGLVRLTLASTLQRLPIDQRTALASMLMSRAEDAEDHNLPLMVWYGLMPVADREPLSLVEVAMQSRWPKTQRLIARRLAETMHQQMEPVDRLLTSLSDCDDRAVRANLLGGIEDAMKGWAKAPQPASWKAFVDSIAKDDESLTATARALGVVFGDGRAMSEIRDLVLQNSAEIGLRRSALLSLINQRPADLKEICIRLLGDQRLSGIAAKGLTLDDDPANARLLIKNYGKFRGTDRPGVIAALASRETFAAELIDAIARGSIAKTELSAFDVRQIRSFGNDALNARLAQAWGETRESPLEKKQAMAELKEQLTAPAEVPVDLVQGRLVFTELCGKCHRLYGVGQTIGPDLTGSNRNNLDYLIENIIDPSAVVSADYRVSVLMLSDGRILNGVIVSENDRTISLQTQTELVVIEKYEIEDRKQTALSPMPDGQMATLTPQQIRNLFAYLQHPIQVALP
ncbi:MAG: PVC-type heme-binding CxxCH protein [Planctomycetaceae bacterium]